MTDVTATPTDTADDRFRSAITIPELLGVLRRHDDGLDEAFSAAMGTASDEAEQVSPGYALLRAQRDYAVTAHRLLMATALAALNAARRGVLAEQRRANVAVARVSALFGENMAEAALGPWFTAAEIAFLRVARHCRPRGSLVEGAIADLLAADGEEKDGVPRS